jgi:hypothetical protein
MYKIFRAFVKAGHGTALHGKRDSRGVDVGVEEEGDDGALDDGGDGDRVLYSVVVMQFEDEIESLPIL